MHFAEVVNFTQLNLVQVAAQGYTAETEKKLSDTPSPAESSQQTKPNGHLSLVANTSLENREIDHELVLRAQRGDKRAFSMLVDKYQRKLTARCLISVATVRFTLGYTASVLTPPKITWCH